MEELKKAVLLLSKIGADVHNFGYLELLPEMVHFLVQEIKKKNEALTYIRLTHRHVEGTHRHVLLDQYSDAHHEAPIKLTRVTPSSSQSPYLLTPFCT